MAQLGSQRHERAIGEQELKRRKLAQKALEKQHERDRQRENHEFRMAQMRLMIAQRGSATTQPTQSHTLGEFGELSLMSDNLLPSHPYSETPY